MQMLHKFDLIRHNVPMMTINSSLLIERLLAYVANISIRKLFSGFELDTRNVLDVGSLIGGNILCWILTT